MTPSLAPLNEVMRVHYGSALRQEERVQTGVVDVFGSSGIVGCHDSILFDYPSIVIGRKGSVGSIHYAPKGGWAIDTAFYIERLNPATCDLRYLFHALSAAGLDRHAITTSIPGLSRDDIYRTKIPLPPLTEQRRIADMLDKANAIRRERKQAISLVNDILRSTFIEMFGDPVSNPRSWTEAPIGDVLSSIESGWSPVCQPRPAAVGEWGVLKLGAVTFGEYDDGQNKAFVTGVEPEQQHEVKVGDVLFARKNTYEHVAACVLVTATRPQLVLPDLLFRLVPKPGLSPAFLWAVMSDHSKRKQVQAIAGGTAGSMPNISKERLRGIKIPVPPSALQRKFSHFVQLQDGAIRRARSAFALAEQMSASLMQQVFGGSGE